MQKNVARRLKNDTNLSSFKVRLVYFFKTEHDFKTGVLRREI